MAILAHLALLGTTLAKTDEVIPETEIDDMEFVKSGCDASPLDSAFYVSPSVETGSFSII